MKTSYSYIGQFDLSFLVIASIDDSYIVVYDQHGLAERIIYEDLLNEFRKNCEYLKISKKIKIKNTKLKRYILSQADLVRHLELKAYNDDSMSVGVFPKLGNMFNLGSKIIIKCMLTYIKMRKLSEIDFHESVLRVYDNEIKQFSCKKAIKIKTSISKEQAISMLDRVKTLRNPFQCIHGRCIITRIQK